MSLCISHLASLLSLLLSLIITLIYDCYIDLIGLPVDIDRGRAGDGTFRRTSRLETLRSDILEPFKKFHDLFLDFL